MRLHVIGAGGTLGVDVEHQKAVVSVGQSNALGGLQGGVQGVRRGGGGVDAHADERLFTPGTQDVTVFGIGVGDIQPAADIVVRRGPESGLQGRVKQLQR